jgi:aspartyl protease family protein
MSEPSSFKVVTVWLLVGTCIFLAWSWWEREEKLAQTKSVLTSTGAGLQIERARDGHYHVVAQVNDQAVPFLLDTGATSTAISAKVAEKIKLVADGEVTVSTANGLMQARTARVDLRINNLVAVSNLRVTILPDLGGDGLLGMDVLGKLVITQETAQGRGKLTLSASKPN